MKNDLRFALRMIATHPWFSAAVVVTLMLAIGVNTTVFTLVNAVLFKPVPLPGGASLAVVSSQNLDQANSRFGVSYPDLQDLRKQSRSFTGLAAVNGVRITISENGNPPSEHRGGNITANLFDLVQTRPAMGRGFNAEDEKPGAAKVAIIGHAVWATRYGRAADVLGRVVRINGEPTTIVGIMPEGFRFPNSQEVWTPLVPVASLEKRESRPLNVFASLKPGVSTTQAAGDLAIIAKRLSSEYKDSNKNIGFLVNTFHEAYNGGNIRQMFLIMLGAVGFVLLIACANVANMMLTRALSRSREISVRTAMGASRWQIVRQLLIESILLSTAGGLLGLGLSVIGVRYFDRATLEVRPFWIEFNMDWLAFAYFAALTIGAGIAFGLAPALRASRVDLANEMKEGLRTSGSASVGRLSGALVIAQFTLTVVLLSGAGLMMRGFFDAQQVNAFVPGSRILAARLNLPSAVGQRYAEPESRTRFFDQLQERLATIPGVEKVALTSNLPSMGAPRRPIEVEGKPVQDRKQAPEAEFVLQSMPYLDTISLPIRSGRGFEPKDGDKGREAAVVTARFAATHWPGQDAIGKRFRFLHDEKAPGPWIQIVGIAGDIDQSPMNREARPLFFLPQRFEPWSSTAIAVRAAAGVDPGSLGPVLRQAVQQLDPDLPLFEVETVDRAMDRWRWFFAVFGSLFLTFAVIALMIASVGVYAVVADSAVRRTREIGIRMALGATSRAVLSLILSRGLRQLAAGLVLGFAGALAGNRLLSNLLTRVSPQDPIVLSGVVTLLAAIGLLACWLPARRAAALEPVRALREE